METANNSDHSTASGFEHVEQIRIDSDGMTDRQQQQQYHRNIFAENNDSICSSTDSCRCCSIVEILADMRSEFQAEIGAVKTENKVLLAKMDVLQAQNGEQKAQIGELRANNRELQTKMELLELKAVLASEQTSKSVEAKMNEMAEKMEEKQGKLEYQQKFAGLEARLDQEHLEKISRQMDGISAEFREKTSGLDDKIEEMQQKFSEQLELLKSKNGDENDDKVQKQFRDLMQASEVKTAVKDKAVKAEFEKMMARQRLMDQGVASLGRKVATLESKTNDAQNNWKKMQTEIDEMSKKLLSGEEEAKKVEQQLERAEFRGKTSVLGDKHQQQLFKLASPNSWGKWNADVTIASMHVAKSGDTVLFGNVMAKFAYSPFYFEVLVKQRIGDICIGVSGTDCTANANGNTFVGVKPGSIGIYSSGSCYNSGIYMYAHFPGGYGTNDIIGCGVALLPGTDQRLFFVTKNGKIHGTPIKLASNAANMELLYPSISLHGQGAAVEANFGNDLANKPFRYNIAEHKFCFCH